MTSKLQDELLRQKMDEQEAAVPADMFERVMNARRKKRRPFAWWWLGMAALCIGVGSAVALTLKDAGQPTMAKGKTASFAPGTIGNNADAATNNHNNSANNNSNAANDLANTASNNNPSNNIASAANAPLVVVDNLYPTNISQNNNSLLPNVTSQDLYMKYPQRKYKNDIRYKNNKLPSNNDAGEWTTDDDNELELNAAVKTKKGRKANNQMDDNQDDALMFDDGTFSTTSSTGTSTNMQRFAELQTGFSLNTQKTKQNIQNIPLGAPEIPCPTSKPRGDGHWFTEWYFSPDVVSRKMGGNTQSQPALQKDSTESPMISFSAGFNIGRQFGDHFNIRTGLRYTQVNETFKFTNITDIRNVTVITRRLVIRNPGDTIVVSDTSFIQQIGTRTVSNINRYSTLDIPLIVGYAFNLNDWRINLSAGPIFNITSWYNGDALDANRNVISLKSTGYYKTNIGLGIFTGINFMKPLNDHWDFMVEPYLRMNLGSMTNDGAPFTQRYTTYGVNIGLRYLINNRQR
jgi:hypothetical protein